MSFYGLIAHFFLLLNSIPLSECTTVYLSIPLLKDVWVASKFWQLLIKWLQMYMCRYLCGHKFLTPLGKYQRTSVPDQPSVNLKAPQVSLIHTLVKLL